MELITLPEILKCPWEPYAEDPNISENEVFEVRGQDHCDRISPTRVFTPALTRRKDRNANSHR